MSLSPAKQARIARIVDIVSYSLPEADQQLLAAAIESALREQDRDTRHACAEAVLMANPQDGAHDHPLVVECFNRAHQACMNAQSL